MKNDDAKLNESYLFEEHTKERDEIAKQLEEVNYYGFVDEEDVDDDHPTIKESKAFSTWFMLHKYSPEFVSSNYFANFGESEAKEAIVDCSKDKGIDAIIIQCLENTLQTDVVILQTKYISDYDVKVADIDKFEDVVYKIISGTPFKNPNKLLEDKLDEINLTLDSGECFNLYFHFVFVTTGQISKNSRDRLDTLASEAFTASLALRYQENTKGINGYIVEYYDSNRIGRDLLHDFASD